MEKWRTKQQIYSHISMYFFADLEWIAWEYSFTRSKVYISSWPKPHVSFSAEKWDIVLIYYFLIEFKYISSKANEIGHLFPLREVAKKNWRVIKVFWYKPKVRVVKRKSGWLMKLMPCFFFTYIHTLYHVFNHLCPFQIGSLRHLSHTKGQPIRIAWESSSPPRDHNLWRMVGDWGKLISDFPFAK